VGRYEIPFSQLAAYLGGLLLIIFSTATTTD
jgi:hypothetical protein